MKETIIDLKEDLGMMGKTISYLFELADKCEEKNACIDAEGLRHIALNLMKEVFKRV